MVRRIPRGRVVTYGTIARLVGCPAHARRVGRTSPGHATPRCRATASSRMRRAHRSGMARTAGAARSRGRNVRPRTAAALRLAAARGVRTEGGFGPAPRETATTLRPSGPQAPGTGSGHRDRTAGSDKPRIRPIPPRPESAAACETPDTRTHTGNKIHPMKRFLLPLLLVWTLIARAQEPLCIVNGTRCADISSIPPERIERVEQLRPTRRPSPATARRLRTACCSSRCTTTATPYFRRARSATHVAARTEWNDRQPAARVVVRYRITPRAARSPTACSNPPTDACAAAC